VTGGVAPMSLMTHTDAVPWGESMRAELIAGHMPPWPVDSSRDRFKNAGDLTARELNVLLTWATGGTPPGDPAKSPAPVTPPSTWPLGTPDVELVLDQVTIAADTPERLVSFVVPPSIREARMVRAIDLQPGTASVVRSAQIRVMSNRANANAVRRESLVSLWQPGERPAVDEAAGFELPADASLDVVVRYRKTWQYEHKEMRDQSRIGLYFAPAGARPIDALTLRAEVGGSSPPTVQSSEDVRLVAVYPDPAMSHVRVSVDVTRPDGSTENVIALRALPGWARRYWFKQPLLIPKGSKYSLRVSRLDENDEPGATTPKSADDNLPPAVTLNLTAAR
jgi:hypothetical protein